MFYSQLPKILRTLRLWHGYSQAFIAERLGLGQQAYSNYERGLRQPDAGSLYTLAQLYSIPMEALLNPDAVGEQGVSYISAPASSLPENPVGFLDYLDKPEIREKINRLSPPEKELMFYYDSLSPAGRRELIEFARLKLRLDQENSDKPG